MRRLIFLLLYLCLSLFAVAQSIQTNGPTSFCEGGSVRLTLSGVSGSHTYQWTKDGNNITGATSTAYVATTSGSYNITITPAVGTINPVVVTVNPKPIPDFLFPANACAASPLQFTSTVTSGTAPFTYAWDFGDGGTANLQSPSHTFTSFGCGTRTFTVRVTVTDANGCTNTITKSVTVKQVPDIDMTDQTNPFSPFNNCNNSPSASNAIFSVQLAFNTPSPSCATTYAVNWGDGSTLNALSASSFPLSHTYTQLGTYELTVTVNGSNGCSYSKVYKVVNQSNPAVGIETPGSTTGCAPSGFQFKLKGYESNSPGTTYTWDFDDGSPTETWTTPVTQETIFHLFTSTSCTKPGGQYVVNVTAENGCKATTATVNNITIYTKPKADFTTPGTGCVNKPLSFTNTTVAGYNQGCNRLTNYSWDFGDGSPIVTGSNVSQSHTYTASGTYTVTLTAEGSCGKDIATHIVCVVNSPTASFTLDKTEACGPATVTATNTSSTLNGCSSANYQWTVTYAATNCGTSAGWSFASNTTASAVDPSFAFTNPGTYTIKLSIATGCGTITATKTVVIKAPPKVSLAAISNACGSVTITPTATVTNCGNGPVNYSWVIDGGAPITTSSPGSITFSLPGTHTITLTVENECGSTTASRSFTVTAAPAVNPPSNQVYCPGTVVSTYNFAGSASGATYSWTNSNTAIGLGFSGATSIVPAFTTTNAGTATITLRATLNGCTTQATYTITVNARPAAPLTSPMSYCKDATSTALTATGTSGYTLIWYNTASSSSGSTVAPVPSTSTLGTTTYYVSQSNPSTGCESARAPLAVTVFASPVISGSAFTNPTSCVSNNGTITLTGLSPNSSYTVSYTFNGAPATKTVLSNSSGSLLLSALASGLYDRITVSQNGCSSGAVGPITLADPNPPAAPVISSNNSPLCSGSTLTLTATGAPSSATYMWTTPSGNTVTGAVLTITNATTSASGTYSVKAVLNGCSSTVATTVATINPTPSSPSAASNSPLCQGASLNLTANSTTSGVAYAWTGPNGFTSNVQNPSLNNVSTAANGTYTVSATLGTCSASKTTIVTINNLPVISSFASTGPTGCNTANGSITLSGLQPNTRYSVQYSKDAAPLTAVSLVANASGVLTIPGLGAGTYTSVTASLGGCTSTPAGPFLLAATSAPAAPVATSNAPICSGGTLRLSATSSAAGAISYHWTGPNGFNSDQQNPVLTGASTLASGDYFVTAVLNGCSSPAGQVNVVVHPTPVAPDVAPVTYCVNDVANRLSAIPASNNTLNWYDSQTGGNAFPGAPVPLTTTAGTTFYYVSQTSDKGCESPRAALPVTVNPKPLINSSRYTDPSGCSPNNGSITLNGLSTNTLYSVQYSHNNIPVAANIRSDGTGSMTIASLTAGTYTGISVRLGGCTSNSVGPFTLVQANAVLAAPKATASSPVCVGSTLNLFASSVTAGVTYHWVGPGGFTSNQQNPTVANITQGASGKYYVWVQLDNCLSEKDSVVIVVGNVPADPVVTSPIAYCEGELPQPLAATASVGDILLWYADTTGGTGSTAAPVPPTTVSGSQIYYVAQRNGTGCESNRSAITVTVHAKPHASITAESKKCQGENVAFTGNVQSQEPIRPLAWSFTNGATATGTTVTYPFGIPGTYGVKLLAMTLSGCSDSAFHTIQIEQAPTLKASQDMSLCEGQSTQLHVTGATAYQWNPINNLSCASCPDPVATPASTTQYVVEGRNAAGCRSFDTVKIMVQQPFKISASKNDSICIGSSITLLATGAPQFQWSPAQGLSSTTVANPTATPTATTRYMVVGYDANSCFTDTAHVTVAVGSSPTVSLGPDLTLSAGTLQPLITTITGGPIRSWSWAPASNLSCTGCALPVAEIKRDISYTVKVTTPFGCSAIDTININVFCEQSTVFVPNAFTPDGDGINDVLMVRAKGVVNVKYFRIFNRWGVLVFEKSNFQPNNPQYGWDGKIQGIAGGPDVFVYTCEVTCENGASFTYKGNVSIIK